MQISYHSTLTNIQKLQTKKTFFSGLAGITSTDQYCPKLADMAGTWPIQLVFFPVRIRGVICIDLLAGTVYISRYGTKSAPLLN